jgi:superfamily II DNA/RNA helicase
MFVSATPGPDELARSKSFAVDMFIRPTNIVDPSIDVRPSGSQLKDLEREIRERAVKGEKTLVMALTKRDAEDMSAHLIKNDIKADYIHSDLTTPERSDALKALQNDTVDCLVGVNLMREGLDLPQVSLVAILGADCEGFLRGETALMQMIGRAARNVNGKAILYANRVTKSMRRTLDETERRRAKQLKWNEDTGAVPVSTRGSEIKSIFDLFREEDEKVMDAAGMAWAKERADAREKGGKKFRNKLVEAGQVQGVREKKVDGEDGTCACGRSERKEGLAKRRPRMASTRSSFTGLAFGLLSLVLSRARPAPPGRFWPPLTRSFAGFSPTLQDLVKNLPDLPGVYIWREDKGGEPLYVGKAKKLKRRCGDYLTGKDARPRINLMMKNRVRWLDFYVTPTEHDALSLEAKLVNQYVQTRAIPNPPPFD